MVIRNLFSVLFDKLIGLSAVGLQYGHIFSNALFALAIGALELSISLVNSQWFVSHRLGLFSILGLTTRVQVLSSHGKDEDISHIKGGS